MNVLVEQRGIRSVEVVRRLVIEVPNGVDPSPEQIERALSSADADYGPFRFSPVRGSQNLEIHSTTVIGRTNRPADVPLPTNDHRMQAF
jgi:hypothetical protein